jgi:SAM-dependent methyltransferase
MDYSQRYYPEMRFGGFSRVDGTIAFYSRVQALTSDDATVIDVGCGRGAATEDSIPWRRAISTLRGLRRHVIGIDVDPAGATNPLLDEFRKIDDTTRWPIEDAVADVCVADYVLEHVTDPQAFFSECRRVLKPGGYLCVRTPNRLGYVTVISSLIPNRLHSRAVQIGQATRKAEDVFPTVYRSNTRWRLRRDLKRNGLTHASMATNPNPATWAFPESHSPSACCISAGRRSG